MPTTDPAIIPAERGRATRKRQLGLREWLLLGETVATLAAASAAIGLLPFRKVVRLASRGRTVKQSNASGRVGTDQVIWAIEAVARRMPWRTVCFQKGLALHLMLRRRGVPAMLHYGAGKDPEGALAAHVWISVDGQTVLGGDVADRFHCLATYPQTG
ncbi:lasso peptide biosynthesis B2 protein [Sphingomonas sp.]|uniref:lasso peptide biosynthesis B2 protein n=1 Tax=Sphingomonas sp. TaxID=28214 RepID=UPI002D800EA2|nr:lasso peptide biosynthesis B2 protein [Sphingomonas sp.]HEU0044530.1 lasso peptide biosynthesis B2 protein [Sphingomonas sp.]